MNLFFEMLVMKKVPFKKVNKIDVSLEKSIGNGQIDIFINLDDKFAVAIENKPFADDQDEQIVRYCDYMKNQFGEQNFLMIYLSANGTSPHYNSLTERERTALGDRFQILSYPQIREWLLYCIEALKKRKATRLINMIAACAE